MRRFGPRTLLICLGAVLCLIAGLLLHVLSPRKTAVQESAPIGPPRLGAEQTKEGAPGAALAPAVHAIPARPRSAPLAVAPAGPNPEPSPSTSTVYGFDDPPPGTVESPPPVVRAPAYDYDAIAATPEERRAADQVASQLQADEADILAKARSGELSQRDVKPALQRTIQTETDSLNQIFGPERAATLREAENRPGG